MTRLGFPRRKVGRILTPDPEGLLGALNAEFTCSERPRPRPDGTAVTSRAELDPEEDRGFPSRPDPRRGGCRGSRRPSQKMQQACQRGQHGGLGACRILQPRLILPEKVMAEPGLVG